MKFMLLIHQGDAPTPRDPEAWATLSESEQGAVFSDYKAINETAGVTPGQQLGDPALDLRGLRPKRPGQDDGQDRQDVTHEDLLISVVPPSASRS